MLASHTEVVTFPETHFFSKTMPINSILRYLKLYGMKDRNIIINYLSTHRFDNIHPFQDISDFKKFTHRQWSLKLLTIIDKMASSLEERTSVWIEKTPRHLHYISSIASTDLEVKFLHILRNGVEVVASLHLATKNYPKEWGGIRSIDKCIKWWNNSIKASKKYKNAPNHHFVVYDDLIENPEKILLDICCFLSIDFESDMVNQFHKTAQRVTNHNEKWKSRNTKTTIQKSNKLYENFDSETIKYITDKILPVDLRQFCNY